MAKPLSIASKDFKLKVVGAIGTFEVSRIQNLTLGKSVPTTDVDELGNPLHVGQSRQIPAISFGFTVLDVGVKLFSALTGQDSTAYPAEGVDISNLGEIDALLFTKNEETTKILKSIHAKRMQIQNFTFNYAVDQDSTEQYNLIGTTRRQFKNDVTVDIFPTGTVSFTLDDTPVQLNNGDYALVVKIGGVYLNEVSGAPSTGEYRIVGTTLTTGTTRTGSDKCIAEYQKVTADAWTAVSDTESAISIQGKDVVTLIAANNIPRIQTLVINGDLTVTEVKELGNRDVVGYQRQVPKVTGTLTVLETDTELVDLFTYGSINSGNTEFEIGIGCTVSGLALEVKLQDPCDTDATPTILKTVYIPEIEITGDSYTANVNQNVTVNYPYRSVDSQCIVYSGARA